MPPKRITVQPATRRSQPKGWFGQVYHTLTSEENSSVVISVAMFGVSFLLLESPRADTPFSFSNSSGPPLLTIID
ncbi:hypothetical protein Z517_04351 [Fonsecaea pedrosoi CBS 271.37]|uniref:Uncharacterized protein n=1 Tax=Fonsecaea pedrosoi CBS 271.37 TaxID=1442368 RepID=A0A0D2DU62_9EURO|nr:uncharacterized protein Z517_04351 [Fonsecaea pedrosoi CBS 271.37]KIW81326.1 hypothetical protein Z517_04351 [Fonsecaea pedrosoi CBS 271.37]